MDISLSGPKLLIRYRDPKRISVQLAAPEKIWGEQKGKSMSQCANSKWDHCNKEVHYCRYFSVELCELHHAQACGGKVQVGNGPFTSLWHAQVPRGMRVEIVPLDPEKVMAILVPA